LTGVSAELPTWTVMDGRTWLRLFIAPWRSRRVIRELLVSFVLIGRTTSPRF
jgi:hypothetical protein